MNAKAQRSEVQFPLLLNLSENRPFVSNDFRSVEHINSPYINGMITPLWKKEYEYINKPVYDYKNNRYEIKDGFLYKNDSPLFSVDNRHFVKEDVTEEYQNYLGFDFADDGTLAKLEWNTGTNSAILTFGSIIVSSASLFVNGVILASRVRVVEDGTAIGVIVYKVNSTTKMLYINSHNTVEITNVVWCTTMPKTTGSAAFTIDTILIEEPSPIINIANPLTNYYAVSLVSNCGEVLYTRSEGFFTFLDYNGTNFYQGQTFVPAVQQTTETIRNYEISNFIFFYGNQTLTTQQNVYNRDNKWYYVDDPETEVPGSDSMEFNPYLIPNSTFEYEGVVYRVYYVYEYENKVSFKSLVDDLFGKAASITVNFSDGHTETATYTNRTIEIMHTDTSWVQAKITPVNAVITFGGTDYQVDNLSKEYTITIESSPTTVQAYALTAPNVFLDNGNMYSWYTIPEASMSANQFPQQLAINCLIVESGKFTGINGNGQYTFDTIEAHYTTEISRRTRENSIAVGQNFWDSTLKLCTSTCKTPRELYGGTGTTSTAADGAPSASTKYIEYSNSNCSDMLYYAGTCPRNDQSFYKYATSGSEDVAWFNPGGFRAPLKGKWNILYYVDSTGYVVIQGISYAEDENKMGTLVTPYAANSDISNIGFIASAGYIASCPDFVVYTDDHNRMWKISTEEGAQLRSIFDNKYIIVNTTSYWNMWDTENNRKYHYASDFNNRVKLGLERSVYRQYEQAVYTKKNRRKYASAINPNYDILPRLPVTSIIPASLELAHILEDNTWPNFHPFGCVADESREVQAIELYLQSANAQSTSIDYLFSLKVYTNDLIRYKERNLVGKSYSDTKSILAIADIFSTYINGAGNNDFIVENGSKYSLVYNNQIKPTFIYSLASGIDVDNNGVQWFFVIQGQYYAVINEKLYSMIYSSGKISQSDAIVDIRGMKYVGNTPSIAFFVNPNSKQVYSFTGDANLNHVFDASKFSFELVNDEITHWYDESTQTIYIKTDKGLLVFGPQNTYLLEDYVNVSDIEFVDGDTHIIDNSGLATTLRYYHDREGFDTQKTFIETSFFGLGATEITSIDRWQIVLYDPEMREQDVYLQVRSLTDVSTQAEEKKLHINSNDWDKWSHSVLLSFSPKLIKGQGIRLTIKTDSSIMKIIPHIMDARTSTTTNSKFSV